MNTKLLPCPFCGSEHLALYGNLGDPQHFGFWVSCTDCHSHGSYCRIEKYESATEARNKAIELWNTRAPVGEGEK